MMLAQATDLPAVPDSILKWVLIVLITFGVLGLMLYLAFRRPEKTRVKIDDDPAIEVRKAAKPFNHDLNEHRFSDHERRIGLLEKAREEFFPKLESFRNDLNLANEQRASRIHDHIDAERTLMDAKVDGIFDRIIATLKNLGRI